METEHRVKGKIGNYIMILLLVAAVVGLGMHFLKPKEVDTAANDNMTLFINNKISDIDEKLAQGDKIPDIATELSWHKSNTALFNEVKANKDKAIKEKREALKEKMVKIQTKEFPQLRDAYVSSKKEVLGQEKIDVALSGENKDVLTFTGGMFEPKKTQKSFTKSIEDIVSDLRFKKIVYKWSDKKTDFADYKIDSKTDKEI